MIDQLIKYLPLITVIGGILFSFDKWATLRQIRELKLNFSQKTAILKTENSQLISSQKSEYNYSQLVASLSRVEAEMRFLRDKASERHGEIQAKMGTVEMRLNEVATKHTLQIDELYRKTGGRRVSDMMMKD